DSNTTDFSLIYSSFEYEDSLPVTEYWCIRHNYTALIIPGFFIVICLCGLVGNMMVVWFLGFHMKKNPFTVYVLNLAIADFSLLLFLLAILTLFIISTLYDIELLEYIWSHYVLMVLFLFFYYASMYLLTAMSIERCASVL
ncbi:MRGRD protein, partial [Nycticryphes semicollaris]|nr:MRGRD protein [Nycticryphes semicollaris]